MAICKICGQAVTTGVVVHRACLDPWVPITPESMPDEFVTVQIHVPSEAPLPTVLPAYLGPDGAFHAPLCAFKSDKVTHWAPMNKPPEVIGK